MILQALGGRRLYSWDVESPIFIQLRMEVLEQTSHFDKKAKYF